MPRPWRKQSRQRRKAAAKKAMCTASMTCQPQRISVVPGEYYLSLDEVLVLGKGLTHPWPLSERGKRNYAAYDPKDDPAFTCEEYGSPQIIFDVYARNWTRYQDRIVG